MTLQIQADHLNKTIVFCDNSSGTLHDVMFQIGFNCQNTGVKNRICCLLIDTPILYAMVMIQMEGPRIMFIWILFGTLHGVMAKILYGFIFVKYN